jgi:hypothetical protein
MGSEEKFSSDEILSMREDLDFAHAIIRHAVRHNLSVLSFSGLRIPSILHTWGPTSAPPETPDYIHEVVVFQEQIYDRIVAVADNRRMLTEIWGFNERSRAFRKSELASAKTHQKVLTETADLFNALFVRDAELILQILDRSLQRRLSLLTRYPGKVLSFPEEHRKR